MKHYWKILFMALMGKNPFRKELEQVTQNYEKTARRIDSLDESLYHLEKRLYDSSEREKNCQALIENLRKRLSEKDQTIEDLRKEQNRLSEFRLRELAERDEKIAALRSDLDQTLELLQKANNALGKEVMAQAMLNKTNNALEDLCAAMQSGDVDKMLMATEYLDWSDYLTRIAQKHLNVLKRKNELVERLHFTSEDIA